MPKISELTNEATPSTSAVIPIVQGGSTLRATLLSLFDTLTAFIQNATGAVYRTITNKLRETVSVKDFGAVGDGTTDDTAAFLAACTALGSKGGTVRYFDKHLIDTNLIIPKNVTLRGPMTEIGTPGDNTTANYGNMAAIILNSSATITLSSGSGHTNGLIYRKGMVFPEANESNFSGTTFTVAGDDTFLTKSMVLGFNKAFYSNGYQRPKIQNVNIDCVNGLDIQACFDIARIRDVHCWPFATIAQYALDTTQKTVIQRSGTAFSFVNGGDWNKVTDCFSYGYFRGFSLTSVDSMTLLSCSADSTGPGTFTGQLGFVVGGSSLDSRLVNCQAAAQDVGYYINTSSGKQTRMIGCDSWACNDHSVLVDGGDVSVRGGILRNTVHGITCTNSTSSIDTDGVRFEGLTGNPINYTVSNSKGIVGRNDYSSISASTVAVNGGILPSVAVTDPIIPPINAEVVNLTTGVAAAGSMNGGYAGRKLTLIFPGAVEIFHGGASPTGFDLNGDANFSAVAGSTLTLLHDGNHWNEIGRKT